MKADDFKVGLLVKLSHAVRLRCCRADPIPAETVVAIFARPSPKRVEVGLFFPGDYDPADPPYHHTIRPLGKASIEAAQATGRMFPDGGFCCHKVKLSSIAGDVIGELSAVAREKLGMAA